MQTPTMDVRPLLCTGIISNDCWLIRCDVGRVLTIDDLPDDDLLAIFDLYVFIYHDRDFGELSDYDIKRKIESWQSLVHVCQRWRGLVLGSPRCLNLQLYYIPGTSTSKSLDGGPALPLVMQSCVSETSVDSVIAELKHSDRICQISLDLEAYRTC